MKNNKKDMNAIIKALNDTFESYEENPNILFNNNSKLTYLRYKLIKEKLKIWKKSKKCIYPNCKNDSIKLSHTIPKSKILNTICENKHVYQPYFNAMAGKAEMKKVGINLASTFPGFCPKHENSFKALEDNIGIEHFNSFGLQIFRTICREIARKKAEIESLEMMKGQINNFRNNELKNNFLNNLPNNIKNNPSFKFQSLSSNHKDSKIEIINRLISDAKIDKNILYNKFYSAFDDSNKKQKHIELFGYSIDIDHQIPIVVAGIGNFYLQKKQNVMSILNILPYPSKTIILMVSEDKYKDHITAYINHFKQNPLSILTLIETWLVHGTDHWFIRPSIWDKLTKLRQRAILTNILDLSKNIGYYCDYSIFDNIRNTIIANFEKSEKYKSASKDFIKFINKEKKKLTNVSGSDKTDEYIFGNIGSLFKNENEIFIKPY